MDSTILVGKIKVLISCAVTAQLIGAFIFTYADCWISDASAQMLYNEVDYHTGFAGPQMVRLILLYTCTSMNVPINFILFNIPDWIAYKNC